MSEAAVLVTWVGAADGAKAAAAALVCAGSDADRAGLLVDLAAARPLRPSLIATAAARELEERLVAHLPEATVASRGQTCHLALPAEPALLERVPAALALARDSVGVVLLPPELLQPALEEPRIRPIGGLLRADLERDRALVALAARDLLSRDVPIAVLKGSIGWIAARLALAGLLPENGGGPGLDRPAYRRLVEEISVSHQCYSGSHDEEAEPARTPQQERRGDAGSRRRRALRRHSKRQAGR